MTDPTVIFFGTPDFALAPLRALDDLGMRPLAVVTQPDRPVGRKARITAPPVKQYALERDIEVLQPLRCDEPAFEARLGALEPDLFVTAAYGAILPPSLLALPRLGAVNIHASLLPKYRGAAPIQAAIVQGETETGVTLMRMDEGLDTGDILAQLTCPIPQDMTAGELFDELADLSYQLVCRFMPLVVEGALEGKPQDASRATMTHCLSREDGRIDFNRSAREVHNLVRGLSPWPGAFTVLDGKRVKICRSALTETSVPRGSERPGSIFSHGTRMFVTCGDGVLELLEIQRASKPRTSCDCCAHNFRSGRCFD